jgi:hypothetical protein
MTRPIQIDSIVGADGVLTLRVPLGPDQANARVKVTVEPVGNGDSDPSRTEWHRFVEETYGSCAGLGLERQPQGEFERREDLE